MIKLMSKLQWLKNKTYKHNRKMPILKRPLNKDNMKFKPNVYGCIEISCLYPCPRKVFNLLNRYRRKNELYGYKYIHIYKIVEGELGLHVPPSWKSALFGKFSNSPSTPALPFGKYFSKDSLDSLVEQFKTTGLPSYLKWL